MAERAANPGDTAQSEARVVEHFPTADLSPWRGGCMYQFRRYSILATPLPTSFLRQVLLSPIHTILLVVAIASTPELSAQTRGIVVTDRGAPVIGARVWSPPVPGSCRPGNPIFQACGFEARTDSNGRFEANGAPTGSVCADPVDPPQIQACLSRERGELDSSDLRIVMRLGVLLRLEVADSGGFINRGAAFSLQGAKYFKRLGGINPVIFGASIEPNTLFSLSIFSSLVIYDSEGRLVSGLSPPSISIGITDITIGLKAVPAFVNAASYWPGLVRDGLASLFAPGLTNVRGVVVAEGFPLPTELAGTSLTIGGISAPILSVANIGGQEQINFQVPLHGLGASDVVVRNSGIESRFFVDSDGRPGIFGSNGQAAILHSADYSAVTPLRPAKRGEIILIYATNLGVPSYDAPPGFPAPTDPLATCIQRQEVRIDAIPANLRFCGLAPGFVGVFQMNVEVPQNASAGMVDLFICTESCVSRQSNMVKLVIE
jgi:uncharacterized protein (TIGR03437 family)